MKEQNEVDYEEHYANLWEARGFQVAVAISAIGLVVYAVALVNADLVNCSQDLALTGDLGVVKVCRSLRPADFLPLAFFVGLLLLPSYEKFKIPGLEGERRPEKRARKQFEEEAEVAEQIVRALGAEEIAFDQGEEEIAVDEDLKMAKRREKYFDAVHSLDEDEMAATIMYYHSPRVATQAEIAEVMNLSQGRVSQLLKSARRNVEEKVGEKPPANRDEWFKWMGYEQT